MTGNRRHIPPSADPGTRIAIGLLWDELERLGGSTDRESKEHRVNLSGAIGTGTGPVGSVNNGTQIDGLQKRKVLSYTTPVIGAGQRTTVTMGLYSACDLLKIVMDGPAWVVFYDTDAARVSDSTRMPNTDPTPGTGVMLEVITTSSLLSIPLSPIPVFANDDSPVGSTAYIAITNLDIVPRTLTINMTVIQREG